MDNPSLHDDRWWPYVLTLLPGDLDHSARASGALVRCRHVPNAEALIRLALAYGLSDLSLKDVAAWGRAMGLADLTGPGLFYRLREAESWLEVVLAKVLEKEMGPVATGFGLRVVDATTICGPGAKGTDWRAHVLIDALTGEYRAVELTDHHGGESFWRHDIKAGELVLGDRGYAMARGIWSVKEGGGEVLARLNPHALRVCGADGSLLVVVDYEDLVPAVGAFDIDILIPIPPEKRTKSHRTWKLSLARAWVESRLVAAKTSRGDIIWLVTTLSRSQASGVKVMGLYRLRWQIELFFKRLKTLLHLDTLPTRHGPTAKSWLLSRFLAAALAQKLLDSSGSLSPWGYEL